MSTEFEFNAKVKEADDIDIKEYSFSPTLLENGVIDYSNIEHDKIFLVNKHDILEKERPGWIPELDLDGLMADEFLPTTIKSSDGFYYVQAKKFIGIKKYETTVYKMSSDILAATVDYYIKKQKALNKQAGKKETVGLPRSTESMYTTRFQNMVDLLRFIPEYKENEALLKHYSNRSKTEAYKEQNKIIFNQYKDLLGNLKDKILDLNLDKIDYGNAYTKGEITSYGDTGLSNSLYEDLGVRIKKQNGSTFTLEQKERLKETLKYVHTYYGDLSNISKDYQLKVSYADNCNQHARKAIGLFTPYHNAIGISFFDDNTYERTTAVHEFAHFLDYTKGKEFSYRYASDKDGSLENQIATKYKKLIREQNENNKSKVGESKTINLGDYWYRTCECFARAMEQDFELTIGLKEKCEPPAYLPEEIFNKEIKPLIEELKKENEIKLNLIPGKFVTLTTKIKNKINEQEMSDRERNNLIWLEEVHGCDKEKTAIVLHKLYEKFSELEAFERSKALPTVFGKLRKQSESFELDFKDSSINAEELDTVLGIYDENITYHTVLDREWAVRHGMSKKEAAHLLEWDYSKAKEHKFIEIINKEEQKGQEKENMSDVLDNKIENNEEYANELADWIIQESLECSVNKENYHISFEDIVEKTNTPIEWLNQNYKLVNEALAKHNDNELLEYNPKESNENEFNLNFCSNATENDENTLFKQNKQGRWVRKTEEELEQELKNNTKTIEIDSIFETVSKEFNEKNKDFFSIYEEEKSKQIENLSKNISNIKEKMLFSKIHSEMLKIRVEELKEMVKRCPNKDFALDVGIRYFNYFGNIEGNISHQNIYTRFGIGHYEKDQMVYPTPEELKSFISKLYENSKTQETYIWNHNEDGSGCLKAPNGEKFFQYDPDANEVKITEDSNWIGRDELNLGDKTFTQYAEDYVLEKNAATYISFETNGKNIEKEQNVDESKQYSFFVKDTAEFEMFEEFETITGLTAKEAISEYKKLREDGLKAGIGINIPSDTTFDDPKGLGTTILVRENGVDTFDIYGDSFIVDLKENNEKSQNRIAAYKELYEELQRAGLNVKEPKFLFDKHLELNNYKDSGEISIYRNKIFQINWLVKTLNISSETADMFYDNYTAYEEVGKNYPDWNYKKNTITIFEERNNKLDYYEVSPLEICEIALKHAKNKEEIEIIKTVMSKQNSLEKGNELGLSDNLTNAETVTKEELEREKALIQERIRRYKEELSELKNTDPNYLDEDITTQSELIRKLENQTDEDIKKQILWKKENQRKQEELQKDVIEQMKKEFQKKTIAQEEGLFSYNETHPSYLHKNKETGRKISIQPEGRLEENIKNIGRLKNLSEATEIIEKIKSMGFDIHSTASRVVIFNDDKFYDFDTYSDAGKFNFQTEEYEYNIDNRKLNDWDFKKFIDGGLKITKQMKEFEKIQAKNTEIKSEEKQKLYIITENQIERDKTMENELKTLIEKRKEIEDELKDIEQKKHFPLAEAAKVSFTNSLAEINQNIENKVFEQLNGKLNKDDYPGYKLGIDTYVVDDKDYFSINFKNEKNGINLSVYEGKFDSLYNIEELDSIKEKTIRVLKVFEKSKLFMTFEEKVQEVFSSIEIELREPKYKEIFLKENSICNDILNVYRNGKLYGYVLEHNRTDKAISFVDNNKESVYVYGDFVAVHQVDSVKEYLLRNEAKGIYEELIISPEENWKLDKELLSKVKEADKSKRPSSSIWGTAQSCNKIIPGVYTVTTAGHGGLLVHKSVADIVLSEEAKKEGSFYRNFYQFEEDNLINIPLLEMYHKHLCETLPWNVEKKDKLYKNSQRDILRNEPEYAKYFYETYNKHPQQTKNTYISKPVTLEEILSVMDFKVDISDSGKIKIFDNQRGEYIDNGEDFEGNENEAYEFTSASEIFERLDTYINDYFINDMVEQLNENGVGPASLENLEDICRIYKNELEKGNTKLSEGELNLAMGIVEPDTVIMPEIIKQVKANFTLRLKDFTDTEELFELKEHLSQNGYSVEWKETKEENDYISFSSDFDEYSYIQTILDDRNIDYSFKLGLVSTGYDAAWLDFSEQTDAEIISEEEFKRINELKEKTFKDTHLPYIKINFTEGSTVNHKYASIKNGTVLGFVEGIELIDELNKKFNTFLKADIDFCLWNEKENDYTVYDPGFEFHDNIQTLNNGKEIPYTQTPITEEIRMICSYPEVLDLFEETWIKQFAPTITEKQKVFVKELTDASYTKLNERYNQEKETLRFIYDKYNKVHSSYIIEADVADTVEQSLETQQQAIARLFDKTLEQFVTKISLYLDENKDLLNKIEFLEYAKHKIFNVLQDVQFQKSRNAKYGKNGYDFDFAFWSITNEKILAAGDYSTEFGKILAIKEMSLQQTEEYGKEIKESFKPLSQEKTFSESSLFVSDELINTEENKIIFSDVKVFANEKGKRGFDFKVYISEEIAQKFNIGESFIISGSQKGPGVQLHLPNGLSEKYQINEDELKEYYNLIVSQARNLDLSVFINREKNEPNIPLMPVVSVEEAKTQIIKEEIELPFSINKNVEKEKINIIFDKKLSKETFNNIISDLKKAKWKFSPINKMWFPSSETQFENNERFVNELQEKYGSEKKLTKTEILDSKEQFLNNITNDQLSTFIGSSEPTHIQNFKDFTKEYLENENNNESKSFTEQMWDLGVKFCFKNGLKVPNVPQDIQSKMGQKLLSAAFNIDENLIHKKDNTVNFEFFEKKVLEEIGNNPFILTHNSEEEITYLKFNQKLSKEVFNNIISDLKEAGWKYNSVNKQWFTSSKAIDANKNFVTELQKKYSKLEEKIIKNEPSSEEFSESQIQKNPYEGIKFFDRNYKEIDEFVAYFNRNLDVFGKDIEPIDEKIAKTIFESLQIDRVGTLDSRTIRLGLDASDNLILVNKDKSEVETKQIGLKELFSLAKETLEKSKEEIDKSINNLYQNENKEQLVNILKNLFQTAKRNNTQLINKMDIIFDTYLGEKKSHYVTIDDIPHYAVEYMAYGADSELNDEEKNLIDDFMKKNHLARLVDIAEKDFSFRENPAFGQPCNCVEATFVVKNPEIALKPLVSNSMLGDYEVMAVCTLADGVYKSTLAHGGLNDDYFVLDNSITSKISPELKQYLKNTGERTILSTSSRVFPHFIKELIDKNLCPSDDNEYYQKVELYVEKNPLDYEVLYPVTKNNFKERLKEIVHLDQKFNNQRSLKEQVSALMFFTESKKEIIKWLNEQGCVDEITTNKFFSKCLDEKNINKKNINMTLERGE